MTPKPDSELTKIEQFALDNFGIRLLPFQLELIAAWSENKSIAAPRRAGITNAKKVVHAYIKDSLNTVTLTTQREAETGTKVEVYADTFNNKNESTLVWQGFMQSIPRKDDVIFIFEGWGGARVTRVYWELDVGLVEVHIDDLTGEYKSKMRLQSTNKEDK